jgi:hypothetical protein
LTDNNTGEANIRNFIQSGVQAGFLDKQALVEYDAILKKRDDGYDVDSNDVAPLMQLLGLEGS